MLSLGCVLILQLKTEHVLQFWGKSGKHAFPYYRHVAQQVYGNQASAAQIERDFSGAGNLLTGKRSRLDTYWVEMALFLYLNQGCIPKIVPAYSPKGHQEHHSQALHGEGYETSRS